MKSEIRFNLRKCHNMPYVADVLTDVQYSYNRFIKRLKSFSNRDKAVVAELYNTYKDNFGSDYNRAINLYVTERNEDFDKHFYYLLLLDLSCYGHDDLTTDSDYWYNGWGGFNTRFIDKYKLNPKNIDRAEAKFNQRTS